MKIQKKWQKILTINIVKRNKNGKGIIMEFIKNEKEREKTFFKLWNDEIKINPQNYKFVYGNDILFFKGITQEELQQVYDFCNKYQIGRAHV